MTRACTDCGLLHPAGTPCISLSLPILGHQALADGATLAARYRILHTIHRGGMSVVYLAEDSVQDRHVAIKELRLPEGATAEELAEAEVWFARESYLLSVLSHPLIPCFYSVFREHDRSYIVQEYLAGENLEHLMERHEPIDQDTVVSWAVPLCELLAYLHALPEPVIFRDLKPANILLRQADGRPAVVDFGIARPFVPARTGTVVGTPGYAPPEQYQGLATPQSDIYALGATLHRLLTGYDPEHAEPFRHPPVRELNAQVSPALAAVVDRALRLNPAERFATAAEMAGALRRTRLRPIASVPAARPPRGRQLIAAAMAAAVVAPMLLRILVAPQMSPTASFTPVEPALASPCPSSAPSFAQPGAEIALGNSIAAAADGTMWFTERGTKALGYMTGDGLVGSCPLDTIGANPVGLASGQDGSILFTEENSAAVGRLLPGTMTEFPRPLGTPAIPGQATVGTDSALWFTLPDANQIGQVTSDGRARTYPLPAATGRLGAIGYGTDGSVWFSDNRDQIGRVDTQGQVALFAVPVGAQVGGVAGDMLDGSVWFTEPGRNALGRLSGDGKLAEFRLPTRNAAPAQIVAGTDGAMWFNERGARQLGRIGPDGGISEFGVPTAGARVGGLAVAQDGSIWFTETHTRHLGRIDNAGTITEYPLLTGSHPSMTRASATIGDIGGTITSSPSTSSTLVAAAGSRHPAGSATGR